MRVVRIASVGALALVISACGGGVDPTIEGDVGAPPVADQQSETDAGALDDEPGELEGDMVDPSEDPTYDDEYDEAPPAEEEQPSHGGGTDRGSDAQPVVGGAAGVAIADLADRQGVDESAITVTLTEDVTWRDGSIGCPQPGMSYTMATVPGYRILLELDGTTYHYHGASGRDPFYCATPDDPAAGGGGGEDM